MGGLSPELETLRPCYPRGCGVHWKTLTFSLSGKLGGGAASIFLLFVKIENLVSLESSFYLR